MRAKPSDDGADALDAEAVASGMKQLARSLHELVEKRIARAEARLLGRVEHLVSRKLDRFLGDLLVAIVSSGAEPGALARAAIDARWEILEAEHARSMKRPP